jgi:hypothetical protein
MSLFFCFQNTETDNYLVTTIKLTGDGGEAAPIPILGQGVVGIVEDR